MVDWNKYPLNLLSRPVVAAAVDTSSYIVTDINACELLSFRRFDLYAKLLYIDHKVKGLDMKYALGVYKRHLDIITNYTFKENGQPDKNSFEKYVECFDRLIDVFANTEFDPSISLIPVDAQNVPIDGSHRVSCAAYFNQKVKVVKFVDYTCPDYSYSWFRDKHLLEIVHNSISLELCNWHSNIYMACIWPDAYGMKQQRMEAVKLMERSFNIASSSCLDLGQNGLRNFLIQVYGFMPWVGTAENHFLGIYNKLNEISSANNYVVEFFLFQADSLDEVLRVKDKIRGIFKMDKGAIHITDNSKETKQIANLIYNANSVHHLKYAYPDRYLRSYEMCMDFKSLLLDYSYELSNYIIDSSSVMAIYGIREAGDLDYLTIDSEDKKHSLHSIEQSSMECHDKSMIYHDIRIKDMLFNPLYYFVFNDLKFLSLEKVKKYKNNRRSDKDLLDIKLIESFISNNDRYVYQILLLKNYYRRKKVYLRNCIYKKMHFVLLKLHLLKIVKKILGR